MTPSHQKHRIRVALQRSEWPLGILFGALYVAAIIIVNPSGQYSDERFHVAQETLFYRGDWRAAPELTTIPGYHALLAVCMHVLGTNTLDVLRIVHACFGLLAVGGFFKLRKRLWPGTETIATVQFLCMPIAAPLFFVIYTDVPAVALLLWSAWAAVSGRTIISALLLSLLVLVRQHEFLWAVFLIALVVRPEGGWGGLRHQWRKQLIAALPFAIPIFLFLAFWKWNGSISLSHTQAFVHPDLSFHAGNVFAAILLTGVLMPLHISKGLGGFTGLLRAHAWLLLIPILAFTAFWFLFHADHPFNGWLSGYLDHNQTIRSMSGLIVAATFCFIGQVKLRPPGAIIPFAIVATMFLVPSWLIEPRYLIPPFSLWLAMRELDRPWIEYATTALWLALAALMFYLYVAAEFIV